MTASNTSNTIILISGANQGIGLATAIKLAKEHGYYVIIGSRNSEAGAKAAASLQAEGYAASSVQLDIESDASISAAAEYIDDKFGRLDVLINNGGILIDATPAADNIRHLFTQTFSTNVIGTACLTEAMLPLLRKSALPRVVFVSSRMGSLFEATNHNTSFYHLDCKAYDSSKAAFNMIALNYARILEDMGGLVNIGCPGLVESNLHVGTKGGTSAEVGAERIVELAILGKGGPTMTWSDIKGSVPW